MANLPQMSADDYISLARDINKGCQIMPSHEAASQFVTEQLYNHLAVDGKSILVLVRVYRLTRVEHLLPDLRALVPAEEQFAMVLTGTYGLEPTWRSRIDSVGHKVIPVNRIAIPQTLPMFEQLLVRDMGADLTRLYETQDVMGSVHAMGGQFHIENVPGSPIIPAQDTFVKPYGVQSLVGFGGLMADVERHSTVYVLIAFTGITFTLQMAQDFHAMQPFLGTALASRADQPIFA